jgi:hypothetical protein
MALTLPIEQQLEDAGLIEFFEASRATWVGAAKETYDYIKRNFPRDAPIRRDDVSGPLVAIVEVHQGFQDRLKENKLKQKYWNSRFADLIIDRTWVEIGGTADGRK